MKCFGLIVVLAWVCAVHCDYRGKLRGPPHAPHPPLPPKIHYGPRPPPTQVFYGQGGGPRPRPHSRPSGGIRGGPYSYKAQPKPHYPIGPPSHSHHSHGSSQSLLSFSGIKSQPHPGLSLGGGQSHHGLSLGGGGGGHGLNFGAQVQHGEILGIGGSHHGHSLGGGASHHGLSFGGGASHHGLSLGGGPSLHGQSLGGGASHHGLSLGGGSSHHGLSLGGGQSSHGLLNNPRPSGLSHHGLLNHAGPASQSHHGYLNDIKQHSHLLLDHKPQSFSQGVLHHRLRPQVVKETFSHSVLNQHQSQPFSHGFLDEVKPHLNSVLDDNKGPIHTIPAPNLSHADKPHGYQGATSSGHGGGGSHLGGGGSHGGAHLGGGGFHGGLHLGGGGSHGGAHLGGFGGAGGAAAVGLSVAHGLGLGNVEIHHSQGYEVHQEPETHDQTGVTPDGRPAYYAPDPDPSLPAHKIPETIDPQSHPSNGKLPLDIVLQQQQEQQQQQFGDIFQQQQHQQQHGDLFLQQQQQQQQQNKYNDIFVQQQQQQQQQQQNEHQQQQLTPDNFLQLFNYGGGGEGGGDFPQQAVDSYGVPVGQESQHHEFHQASQGTNGGGASSYGPDRPLSGGVDNSLVLKTIRQEFAPNFQSFNYDEQRDSAGAGSEVRPKVVQRNTPEGSRGENQSQPPLLGDSSTLPSREAAETLATLQAAGDIISQVHQRQNEEAAEQEQKRTEYVSVETHVSQSESQSNGDSSTTTTTRKKEEANPSQNEVRGDIPVNEDDYDDEEEEERNIIIVRPQVGPIPGSVFYDHTATKPSESIHEAVPHTIEEAVRHEPTREETVSDLTTRHNVQKTVPSFTRHSIKEVTITPRPTHARPAFAIQEDEPTYIESLPTFHDAVPSYTKTTRPITQDAVSYTKSTKPNTQEAVPTYTRTTRPANQKKTPAYTRSKPSTPSTEEQEDAYDYPGSRQQAESDYEEEQQFSQEFGARIKSTKKTT